MLLRRLFIPLIILAPLFALPAQAAGDDPRIVRIPGPGGTELETAIYGEDGKTHPLLLINHGSPGDASARPTMIARYSVMSRWFAKRGFIVAVTTRRGYGHSTGGWAEDFGRCEIADFVGAAAATVADFRATIAYMTTQPNVDASHIVMINYSAGAWGGISGTAAQLPGVIAMVDFAAGRGGDSQRGYPCNAAALIKAAGQFGAVNHVPALWIYAENDRFFPPEVANKMFGAYTKAGGQATFIQGPVSGKDGHLYFTAMPPDKSWGPDVTTFLSKFLPIK